MTDSRVTSTDSQSLYRCRECGNGDHLRAWSIGLFEGPLDAGGHLDRYDYMDDTEVQENSIICDLHIDAVIDRLCFDPPVYSYFRRCEECDGRGSNAYWPRCPTCHGTGGHWTPVEAEVTA